MYRNNIANFQESPVQKRSRNIEFTRYCGSDENISLGNKDVEKNDKYFDNRERGGDLRKSKITGSVG